MITYAVRPWAYPMTPSNAQSKYVNADDTPESINHCLNCTRKDCMAVSVRQCREVRLSERAKREHKQPAREKPSEVKKTKKNDWPYSYWKNE